jgi:hypothetical protein
MTKSSKAAASKSDRGAGHRATTPALAAPPAPESGDDLPPQDIDEFRLELVRRIMTRLGLPQRCREKACRRGRRCAGKTLRCQRDFPGPPMTRAEEARALAGIQRVLKRCVEPEP